MYILRQFSSAFAPHSVHHQQAAHEPRLTEKAQRDLKDTIRENRFSARAIFQHLSSDPAAARLPADRREHILTYCQDVAYSRTLNGDFGSGTHHPAHDRIDKLTSALQHKHVERAQKDGAELEAIAKELNEASKAALREAMAPVAESLHKLDALSVNMSLKPHISQIAKAFLSHCQTRFRSPNAHDLSTANDLRKLAVLKSAVDKCAAAFERLKPFADAGLSKSQLKNVSRPYIETLGRAQDAAMARDWERFEQLMSILDKRVTMSGPLHDAHDARGAQDGRP